MDKTRRWLNSKHLGCENKRLNMVELELLKAELDEKILSSASFMSWLNQSHAGRKERWGSCPVVPFLLSLKFETYRRIGIDLQTCPRKSKRTHSHRAWALNRRDKCLEPNVEPRGEKIDKRGSPLVTKLSGELKSLKSISSEQPMTYNLEDPLGCSICPKQTRPRWRDRDGEPKSKWTLPDKRES